MAAITTTSAAWQSTLISYEQTFNVRQLNWYDVPDPNFGLSYTGTQIPDTQTYTDQLHARRLRPSSSMRTRLRR